MGKVSKQSSALLIGAVSAALLFFGMSCSMATGPSAPPATVIRAGSSFTADPDPILVDKAGQLGLTTLSWIAPVRLIQIRVGAPGGPLMAADKGVGHAKTGLWVKDGSVFYLQDATVPDPTAASATLATIAIPVRAR